jgi:thiol peroxidase
MPAAGNTTRFKDQSYPLVGPRLKAGDRAPTFTCVNGALELTTLEKTAGKPRLFSVVPSLDTPVCSQQTKRFDEALGALKEKIACYTISLDMPFAQKRFCSAEHIGNMQTLSDTHNHSFGKNYGVLIEGLPMPLLARAVFVLDKDGKITYAEYVPEVGSHPHYDNALSAVRAVAG